MLTHRLAQVPWLCLVSCPALAEPPRYVVSRIQQFVAPYPDAVSSAGHVAGNHQGVNGGAFVFGPGGVVNFPHAPEAGVFAHGVNAHGVGVGELNDANGVSPAILNPDGSVETFSPFGGDFGIAYGINDDGWVVGGSDSAASPGVFRAFQWRDGMQAPLEMAPEFIHSMATHVTPGGLVSGRVERREYSTAVTWSNGVPRTLPNPVGETLVIATGSNDHGMTVGNAHNGLNSAAYVWIDGVPHALPGADEYTIASGVDQTGVIAGWIRSELLPSGVIWHEGRLHALDDLVVGEPDLHIYAATAISANGYISAAAIDQGDTSFAVLLTPVPAPAGLAVLGLGGALAMRRRR